jgi:cell wall-associated NlpC family hydrolase
MPIPPKNVQDAAKRALAAREAVPPSRKAGTPVGIARANQLANGENVSEATLLRMWSYLSRARVDYDAAKARGLDLESSKAIQAYYLWGGPAALAWVRRELNK